MQTSNNKKILNIAKKMDAVRELVKNFDKNAKAEAMRQINSLQVLILMESFSGRLKQNKKENRRSDNDA